MSRKNITIEDVARTAGVSKATVSRYLNGRTDLMTAETAERVRSVIELLNYRPSEVARSLKSRKTRTVGVILADEAHRLNEKSGLYGNQGVNQIHEIIHAARLSVFFIDESQRVTVKDIGSVGEIRHWAAVNGAEVLDKL